MGDPAWGDPAGDSEGFDGQSTSLAISSFIFLCKVEVSDCLEGKDDIRGCLEGGAD